MKKVFGFLLFLFILGGFAVQAAPALLPGDVVAIHEGTSLWVINQAINSQGLFQVWQRGTVYAFFAATPNIGNTWSSVFVDIADFKSMAALRSAQVTGQAMLGSDNANFINTLQEYGFRRIGPAAIPSVIRMAVQTAQYARMLSEIPPSLLVVPMAVFPTPVVGMDG